MHIDWNEFRPEKRLYGATYEHMVHHKGMLIMWGCFWAGNALALWYGIRLCSKSPDMCWYNKNCRGFEIMPQYKQYKWFSPGIDFKIRKFDVKRPEFNLREAFKGSSQ